MTSLLFSMIFLKYLFLNFFQMSSIFTYSPLADAFRGSAVNRIYSIANRMVINSTVHLDETEVRGSLRHHVEHAVATSINRRDNRLGTSQLFINGPLSALVEVEGMDNNITCLKINNQYKFIYYQAVEREISEEEVLSSLRNFGRILDYIYIYALLSLRNSPEISDVQDKVRGGFPSFHCHRFKGLYEFFGFNKSFSFFFFPFFLF